MVKFKGMVKNYHYFSPKDWMDKTMKEWPYGSHLVMEYLKNGVYLYTLDSIINLKRCYFYFY